MAVKPDINGDHAATPTSKADTNHANSEVPVTKEFIEFISTATPALLTSEVRSKLKELLLDYVGITSAASTSAKSTPPIFAAITSLFPKNSGSSTVIARSGTYPPHYAALLNAAFTHTLDFDDTQADATLHPGTTSFSTALVEAEQLGPEKASTDDFLTAVAVAYEITCRLGIALGSDTYAQGFHNTSIAGVFGAVAALCVLRHYPANVVADALGLAGSRAAGSMQYLDNGSYNKRLHPGFASHDAFVVTALAEQGVVGASRIIEGQYGFLHAYSPKPNKDLVALVDGLGSKWLFLTTGIKPFPACRMTHALIEMANDLKESPPKFKCPPMAQMPLAESVNKILITLPPNNVPVVGAHVSNKIHPETEVDAQFSAYYQTAHALVYGDGEGVGAYTEERIANKTIAALSDKIEIVAGDNLAKVGARIHVTYEDGTEVEKEMLYPLGEDQHPITWDFIQKKYMSVMAPVFRKEKAEDVAAKIADFEKLGPIGLLKLLKL